MNNIRALLKKKGVLQKEFAIDIGVSQPTVSDWLHNKKDPRGENLLKVAEYFGVSPGEIKIPDPVSDASMPEQTTSIDPLSRHDPQLPITDEAKILAAGIDRMPAKDRERALNLVRVAFDQYEEYFIKGDDADET